MNTVCYLSNLKYKHFLKTSETKSEVNEEEKKSSFKTNCNKLDSKISSSLEPLTECNVVKSCENDVDNANDSNTLEKSRTLFFKTNKNNEMGR